MPDEQRVQFDVAQFYEDIEAALAKLLKNYPEVKNFVLLVDYADVYRDRSKNLAKVFVEPSPHDEVRTGSMVRQSMDIHKLCMDAATGVTENLIARLVKSIEADRTDEGETRGDNSK